MTQQNISLLSKYLFYCLIFLAQTLYGYGEIIIDKNDQMYYKTHNKEYLINDLIISYGYDYVKNNDKWLVFRNGELIRELNYSSLIVSKIGIIGIKNNRYSLLSNDGKLIKSDLEWASINDNGIIIKEKDGRDLISIVNSASRHLTKYDYAKACPNGFYITWNIANADDVTKSKVEWFLINSSGYIVESSVSIIREFSGRYFIENNKYIITINNNGEKTIMDENYSKLITGNEYIFFYNEFTRQWEIHNRDMEFIMEIEQSFIPSTKDYDDIMIIMDRMNQILKMIKLNNAESVRIKDYRIGDKFLFIKHDDNKWERIY